MRSCPIPDPVTSNPLNWTADGHHFTDAQIMELTYAMGSFIGYSKQLIMLGLEPEAMPLTRVPIPQH